jgi:hypothetical protein
MLVERSYLRIDSADSADSADTARRYDSGVPRRWRDQRDHAVVWQPCDFGHTPAHDFLLPLV